MKQKFRIGDRVKIREWDDLAKEFGLRKTEVGEEIKTRPIILQIMKPMCGKEGHIIEIDSAAARINPDYDFPYREKEFYKSLAFPLQAIEKAAE